jgi:hypothetical protein
MKIYHYCILEKSESSHKIATAVGIDMENVEYKRQPDVMKIYSTIAQEKGLCCGIFRGGMFGLATNQIAVFSAWSDNAVPEVVFRQLAQECGWRYQAEPLMLATVRPTKAEKIDRPGVYVIRWIRMESEDVDEYTSLCVETWPQFEGVARARCYGVFKPLDNQKGVVIILMLTWYASLTDWEVSRQFEPTDISKWARRSEMELSHWAEAGRLVIHD